MLTKLKRLFAASALLCILATNAQARIAAFTVICHPVPNGDVGALVHGTITTERGRPILFVARCMDGVSTNHFPEISSRAGRITSIYLDVYVLLYEQEDPAFPKSNNCLAISGNAFLALRCDADPTGAIGAVDVQVSIGD